MKAGDEAVLLNGCVDGDGTAWRRLVDRYAPYLAWVIRKQLSRLPARLRRELREEDLLQEVFLVLLKEDCAVLRRFDRRSSLASYFRGVAVHVVLNRVDAEQRYRRLLEAVLPTGEEISAQAPGEQEETVRTALDRLEDRERLLLWWIRAEGMEYEETARLLQISPNSVGPLLKRAEERFRGLLERQEPPATAFRTPLSR